MSTELEVIKLDKLTLIKWHISKNKTAIMTIEGDCASFEVKTYGPDLPVMGVEELHPLPSENLRKGQLWLVNLEDKKGMRSVKIDSISDTVVTLVPTKEGEWKAGYLIQDVHWIQRQ